MTKQKRLQSFFAKQKAISQFSFSHRYCEFNLLEQQLYDDSEFEKFNGDCMSSASLDIFPVNYVYYVHNCFRFIYYFAGKCLPTNKNKNKK